MNEETKRKNKSISILKNEEVPYIMHLPVIEKESEITLRTKDEICNRAICIALIAAKAEGLDAKIFNNKAKEFEVIEYFSHEEKAFIKVENPNEKERAKFTWRYESLWVLLWSLNYIDTLDKPDKICDVKFAVTTIVNSGRQDFISNAKVRSKSEVLDQADLYFRYHWATKDASLSNKDMPAGIESGVVFERHYALNWLINNDEDWDNVSTNT